MFPPRTEILKNQGEEDKMPEWTDSERANLNMGRGVNVVRRSAAEKFHGRLDYNLSLAAVRSRVGAHLPLVERKVVLNTTESIHVDVQGIS